MLFTIKVAALFAIGYAFGFICKRFGTWYSHGTSSVIWAKVAVVALMFLLVATLLI